MVAKYAESGNTELATVPEGRRSCRTAEGKTTHDLRDGCAESHSLPKAAWLKHSPFRSRGNFGMDQMKELMT